ncbi:ferredoxin [Deinococcus seoulensis]|uniref:Ferredoxin n=2 Tax=Deinococcus seoulensis TaxID=1837379 RepID=A0ABQ2RWR8_9DEIO|nr:ferredoxin [Deinococcus seoulensis]
MKRWSMDKQLIQECIDACLACVAACEACATACLSEPDIDMMRGCIRLDRDYADVCALTARLLMRGSAVHARACALCAEACAACAAECGQHSHEHCQRCAEACRRCEEACRKMAA